MADDLNASGKNLAPRYANWSHVFAGQDMVRLTFGEGLTGDDIHYHTAVVLTPANARAMAELLLRLSEKYVQQQNSSGS
jgi:hypothetical protein